MSHQNNQHTIGRRAAACALLCAITLQPGCEARRQLRSQGSFAAQESEYTLTILLDLSGSYAGFMAEDGRAHRFMLRVIDQYFRDRLGSNDRILIGQLSGSEAPMLWEGTPLQLRRSFPNPEAFADYLAQHAQPEASRVHDGIADALDYVLSDPGIQAGRTRSAVFVLSDMLDNASDSNSEERLLRSLESYGRAGGVVGFYWVHQSLVMTWRTRLAQCGIQSYVVESEIVSQPELPTFE